MQKKNTHGVCSFYLTTLIQLALLQCEASAYTGIQSHQGPALNGTKQYQNPSRHALLCFCFFLKLLLFYHFIYLQIV